MALSMAEKRAVTREMGERYRRATKGGRSAMLDDLVQLTRWSRRHARRKLQDADSLVPRGPRVRQRRARVVYDEPVREQIVRLWKLSGGSCGKRLAPFMGELVAALERHGELRVSAQVRDKLITVSADRTLLQRESPVPN